MRYGLRPTIAHQDIRRMIVDNPQNLLPPLQTTMVAGRQLVAMCEAHGSPTNI
ncbi:MAG: hypothetical protein HRU15_00035 [Planctomycetes bacterium]|nr:hypothetical protein [Planctomycetota bacterium]